MIRVTLLTKIHLSRRRQYLKNKSSYGNINNKNNNNDNEIYIYNINLKKNVSLDVREMNFMETETYHKEII